MKERKATAECQKCRPNSFSNSVVRRHDRSWVDVAWRDLNHLENSPSLRQGSLLLFRHTLSSHLDDCCRGRFAAICRGRFMNDKNQKMEYTCNLSGFLSPCVLLRPNRNHNGTFRQRARRRFVCGKSNKKKNVRSNCYRTRDVIDRVVANDLFLLVVSPILRGIFTRKNYYMKKQRIP